MCAKKIKILSNDDGDKNERSKSEESKNNDKLIKRKKRSNKYPVLSPGWYEGEIVDARLEEYPSDYNKSGMREVIVIDISVLDDDGTEVIAKLFNNLNFHNMSNLSATLRELGIEKPGVDEYLDLTKFVDKKIEVRVGNRQKQGRTYNTVETIKGL
ncbi:MULTISPECIES: hypothetical protein [Halanaerobium]|jgi:hypothetical protein|uniref:Uncharacterized protein n=2 Tax=Halanaerobium TaxID=2330 RepID=A0A1G6QIF1_9FIRM|nr:MULTISPECIES: hypothetical protein [Halanaerobium]TDP89654.1 hypothetical protein C7957_12315 [Halanaerobium saccharolyticum]SDC91931.1 hypothetical protein SAMN04488597_11833 [Halanaerobium congolense]